MNHCCLKFSSAENFCLICFCGLLYYGFMDSLGGTFLVVTMPFQEGGVSSRVSWNLSLPVRWCDRVQIYLGVWEAVTLFLVLSGLAFRQASYVRQAEQLCICCFHFILDLASSWAILLKSLRWELSYISPIESKRREYKKKVERKHRCSLVVKVSACQEGDKDFPLCSLPLK